MRPVPTIQRRAQGMINLLMTLIAKVTVTRAMNMGSAGMMLPGGIWFVLVSIFAIKPC
jgi:hypothetical protein